MPDTKETTPTNPPVKPDLEALLHSGLPPRDLWQHFLQLGHQTLLSDAGVLWVLPPDSDNLVPQGMCGNGELRQAIVNRDTRQIAHVLQAAATDGIVMRQADPAEGELWEGRTFLALPVHAHRELYGVIEFIQPVGQPKEFLQKQSLILEANLHMVEQAPEEQQAVKPTADDKTFWKEFEELSYNLHRSLVLKDIADVAVNDGRKFLCCDRLSVAVLRGKKNKIVAVAGQDLVNRRSEEVRSLERIAGESVSVGEMIEFRSDQAELAPHLRQQLSHHVELTAATLILAIPLYAPSKRRPEEDDDPRSEPIREVVGCLVIEQFTKSRLEPARAAGVPILADSVGSSIANSLSQQQVLFHPTRRILGKGLDYFRGRTLAKTLMVLGLIFAVALALFVVPYEYRVEAEGRLMPETQRRLFAPWDGVVIAVSVKNGQRVSQGQQVLRIYNDELHAELVAAENELDEKQQQMLALRKEISSAARVPTERKTEIQLNGQLQETRLEIAGLQKQLTILRQREESLRMTAPIDGVVATFQLEEKLRDRPVARGEQLLEIMEDNSDWVLELQMPEHRMGHLLKAAQPNDGEALDVEYVLATDAAGSFTGRLNLANIASRSEVNQDSGVVVQMRVETDKEQLPFQRIGGEATAKIACGKMSLGYVLLGDVWEFILRYAWI